MFINAVVKFYQNSLCITHDVAAIAVVEYLQCFIYCIHQYYYYYYISIITYCIVRVCRTFWSEHSVSYYLFWKNILNMSATIHHFLLLWAPSNVGFWFDDTEFKYPPCTAMIKYRLVTTHSPYIVHILNVILDISVIVEQNDFIISPQKPHKNPLQKSSSPPPGKEVSQADLSLLWILLKDIFLFKHQQSEL